MVIATLARRAIPVLISLTLLAFGATPSGQAADTPPLAPPWPEATQIADIAGQPVTFPSHSPFTLADVGAGPEVDPPTTAHGTLFLPSAASASDPAPAIVLLHGAAGVLGAREGTYARQFAAMGVAALIVDSFAARRDRATGFVDRLIEITEAMVLADAYAALQMLAARPEIDGERVALVGFSYGGMTSLYAAYAQVAERYAPDGARFAAHAAYYAPCIVRFEDTRATGAPVLMQFGAGDAIVDPARCAEVATDLERGGAEVRTVVYPRAYHQWDGVFSGPRPIGRDLSACRFRVEADGTVRDARTYLPMWGPLTRKIIMALCIASEPYLIGRDDEVRRKSNGELARFLAPVFALRPASESGP